MLLNRLILRWPDTRLADRSSGFHNINSFALSSTKDTGKPVETKAGTFSLHMPDPEVLASALRDLSDAQRSRTDLHEKLAKSDNNLELLKIAIKKNRHCIEALTKDRSLLQVKLKDRDEELREKAKLLDVSLFFLLVYL